MGLYHGARIYRMGYGNIVLWAIYTKSGNPETRHIMKFLISAFLDTLVSPLEMVKLKFFKKLFQWLKNHKNVI